MQQKNRKRIRRQDSYDLYCLFQQGDFSLLEKKDILDVLIKKAVSRNIDVSQKTISDPEVKKRSAREYP